MFIEQERSIQTRQCFLDAMASLLEEKPFEAISVADIAKRAKRAVGSFYTKFDDKEQILDALIDRYEDERAQMPDSQLTPDKWKTARLKKRIEGVARITVEEFRRRRGLFIAIETRVRLRSGKAAKNANAKMSPLYDRVAQLLVGCKDEIAHADAERAARFAFLLLTSLCSKAILYPADSHPASLALEDRELADRAAHAMYAYLTLGKTK